MHHLTYLNIEVARLEARIDAARSHPWLLNRDGGFAVLLMEAELKALQKMQKEALDPACNRKLEVP
jgi:hypothetical protein